MSEPTQELAEAFAKAIAILGEHMDSGVIIGSEVDEDGGTYKWIRAWGNSFAVTKMVELQADEMHHMHQEFVSGSDE